MKVTVDEDRFRGHVMCLALCPEAFLCKQRTAAPSPTLWTCVPDWGAAVKYALANCPGQTNVEIPY